MKAILEKITRAPEQSIHAFEYVADTFDAPWHFHPECELTYIRSSSGIRYVGNHIADFEAGDLVLLGTNLPHCWRNVGGHHEPAAASTVIQWSPDLLGLQPEFSGINKLLAQARRGLRFSADVSPVIGKRMSAITAATPLNAYLQLLQLLNDLTLLPATPLAERAFTYDGSPQTGERLQRIQQYVTDHYQQKITLAGAARCVNLSETSFSRFFSQAMGRPFFQFLNEYRVNVAAHLLLETNATVAKIGYDCGYDTLPFFYRQFQRFKGVTPGQFRKAK